ncbi:Endochitinase 33 [Claviceps digitariae]|nr:Endochitinase 33 [Claviceps digitariae]
MISHWRSLAAIASMLAMVSQTMAGFSPASGTNIAIYWGQNSYNQGSGPFAQQRLSHYCANSNIDIIPVAFMNGIGPPITNFANAGDNCTAFPGSTNVLSCPQIEADIKHCQATHGKTVILSLGGATYTQGGWSNVSDAHNAAHMIWDMFGPVPSYKTVDRPFGSAVVDGFDFDFEATTNHLPAFGAKLRSLMDAAAAAGEKKFFLAAAPQCVFPDAATGAVLDAVAFDFVMIQFYNNWCGVSGFQLESATQNAFNFDVWDHWAKNVSPNRNVKLLLGIPAAPGAGRGFTNGTKLRAVVNYSQQFSSFGGVMMWDMSQLYANSGFLDKVVSDIADGPVTTLPTSGTPTSTLTSTTSTSTTSVPTTPAPTTTTLTTLTRTSSSASIPSGRLVPQWGQCGGNGYTGPTQCQPPYTCTYQSEWWSMCK